MGLFGALDLRYLDGDKDDIPEFSSLLLVELWKGAGGFKIKVSCMTSI